MDPAARTDVHHHGQLPHGWSTRAGTRSSKAERQTAAGSVYPIVLVLYHTEWKPRVPGNARAGFLSDSEWNRCPPGAGKCGEGALGLDQGNGVDPPLANLARKRERGSHLEWMWLGHMRSFPRPDTRGRGAGVR